MNTRTHSGNTKRWWLSSTGSESEIIRALENAGNRAIDARMQRRPTGASTDSNDSGTLHRSKNPSMIPFGRFWSPRQHLYLYTKLPAKMFSSFRNNNNKDEDTHQAVLPSREVSHHDIPVDSNDSESCHEHDVPVDSNDSESCHEHESTSVAPVGRFLSPRKHIYLFLSKMTKILSCNKTVENSHQATLESRVDSTRNVSVDSDGSESRREHSTSVNLLSLRGPRREHGSCDFENGFRIQAALENRENSHRDSQTRAGRGATPLIFLLLGTGGSGKTTIFNQMRLKQNKVEYGDEDRRQMISLIAANLIQGTVALLKFRRKKLLLRNPESIGAARTVNAAASSNVTQLNEQLANAISILWNDEQFQILWSYRSRFQVLDSYGEFASRCCDFPAWGGPDWNPTPRERLLAYHRTTGIHTESFNIDNEHFKVLDVGGQKSERRKWFHFFEKVTAVVFVVAASEYDQKLFEDRTRNRLVEAFESFEVAINSHWFKDMPILLFLNKVDLFAEKYHERDIPINQSGLFPDAPTDGDVNKGLEWMEKRFIKLDKSKDRNIFIHKICALNPDHVVSVFNSIREVVAQKSEAG